MAKRRTNRAAAREKRRERDRSEMKKPSGKSKYGLKNRVLERARGYSKRETSPFYMSPAAIAAARQSARAVETEAK